MKKLMILAVAMIAMAMGGKAEAALRLTVTGTGGPYYFYFNGDIGFGTVSMAGLSLSFNGASTNNPGDSAGGGYGFVQQQWTLSNIGGVTGFSFTSLLEVVNAAIGVIPDGQVSAGNQAAVLAATLKAFDKPIGPSILDTGISHLTPATTPNVSGTATAYSYVNGNPAYGVPNDMIFDNNLSHAHNPGVGNSVGSLIYISGNYNLANKLSIGGYTAPTGSTSTQITSQSELKGIVPEPTSLALAGFAGIGMAVGAIRRRRQAKQAA